MEHGMDPSAKGRRSRRFPLGVGTNDDLLAALDEMLASRPKRPPGDAAAAGWRLRHLRRLRAAGGQTRRRKRPKDELDYLRAKVATSRGADAQPDRGRRRLSPSVTTRGDVLAGSRWPSAEGGGNRTVVENLAARHASGQIEIAKRLEAAIADHQQEAAAQAFPWNAVKTEFNVEAGGGRDDEAPRAQHRRRDDLRRAQAAASRRRYAQVDVAVRSERHR
ncbi:Voltage-gated Ion Channel (VIC) Superfamily [Phytophthora cinnamomi]|uniref:Voltage-gated Ion Channel (VIC) Superfamily n=1 Tax=Phytophthora cinnamomi TaxID=4785 RepID=UPI00355ACD5A|nr:Voltage-gated Ion Channel (VIC) Superfamily [Phytophthora cinnamomi]